MDVVEVGEQVGEQEYLVYASMVFGEFFNKWILPFAVMAKTATKTGTLVLFCLDEEAEAKCGEAAAKTGALVCVRGRKKTILHKFTLPLVLLNHFPNLNVLWLDLDVFVLQNPKPALERRLRKLETQSGSSSVDLLVSGSFGDDCICTGIVFFRNTPPVRKWLLYLLGYLYEHVHLQYEGASWYNWAASATYEQEQQRVGFEKASADKLLLKYLLPALDVPNWGLLDPVNEFVTSAELETTGWSGEIEKIVMFHMLQGDSD
eukprot:g10717.t1